MRVNRQGRPSEHGGDAEMLLPPLLGISNELGEQSRGSAQLEPERTADSEVIEESLS
jgi:hypothetical protein